MLDNAQNNTVAIWKMQSLLHKYKSTATTTFGLKNCVCCFVHIINICSSHIIASVTFNTKKKASSNPKPNSPADSDGVSSDDSDDELGDGDPDGDPDNELGDGDPDSDPNNELGGGDPNLPCADELALPLHYDGQGKFKPKQWAVAIIECNPLNCAWNIIQVFHSSDLCRQGFQQYISDGNAHG